MSRPAVFVIVLALLAAAQAWLRPGPETFPAAGAGAESSLSVIGGAVRPVFVALAWLEAEAALGDHRVLDALDRLRLLEGADPSAWEASEFRAHLIAHNLADREPPATRADRIVEAVRILESAAGRTRDPGPDVARGQLLLEPRMREPELRTLVGRALGETPNGLALSAFQAALRKAPASEKIARLEMEAARLAGLEILADGGPADQALARLDLGATLASASTDRTLAVSLALAWAGFVRAALKSDGSAVDRARSDLVATLAEWTRVAPRRDDSEAVVAARFARRAVALAEQRLRDGDGGAALSVLAAVHTIHDFVLARLDRSHLALAPDLSDRRRIESLLDEIGKLDPGQSARIAELRSAISAW